MMCNSNAVSKKSVALILIFICLTLFATAFLSLSASAVNENFSFYVGSVGYSDIDLAVKEAIASGKALELREDVSFVMPMNEVLVVQPNGFVFEASTARTSENNQVVTLENEDGSFTVASYRDTGEKLRAMNVALSGMIQLRFYYTDLDVLENNEDAYIEVSVPSRNGRYKVQEKYYFDDLEEDESGRYLVKVSLAVAQQNDKVRLQVVNGENRGKLRQYSVRDYGDIIIDKSHNGTENEKATYAPFLNSVESMLNMGAMAQRVFDYRSESLANDGLFSSSNPIENITDKSLVNLQKIPAVSGKRIIPVTYTVVLEEYTKLRVYFAYSGTKSLEAVITRTYNGETRSETVSVANYNGDEITVGGNTATHFVEINNISANMYDVLYEVEVEELTDYNKDKCVVTKSVLNYINDVLSNPSAPDSAIDLAGGMYLYYVGVSDYLGIEILPEDLCEHNDRYIEVIVSPSCGRDGEGFEKCSDCGAYIKEMQGGVEINKRVVIESDQSSHSFVFHEGCDPDCARVGWADYYTCANCLGIFDVDKNEISEAPIIAVNDQHINVSDGWVDIVGESENELLNVKCCDDCGKVIESQKYTVFEFSPRSDAVLGKQVKIDVDITCNDGFRSVVLTVNGDKYPEGWQMSDFECVDGLTVTDYRTLEDGRTYVILKSSDQSNFTETGRAVTLTFNVGEQAEIADYSFSVDVTGKVGNNPVKAEFASSVKVREDDCDHNAVVYRNVKNKTHEAVCSLCGEMLERAEHIFSESYADVHNGNMWVREYLSACDCGKVEYCYSVEYSAGVPNVFVNAKQLSTASKSTAIAEAKLSDDGTYVTFTNLVGAEDGYIYLYTADSYTSNDKTDDGIVTGRYLLIKYRTNYKARTGLWVGANNGRTSPANADYFNLMNNDYGVGVQGGLITDGNWHVTVIDLAAVKPESFKAESEGENEGLFVADYIRWDILDVRSLSQQSVDVAYVALADELSCLVGIDGVCEYEYVYELSGSNSVTRCVNAITDNPYFDPYQFYKKLGAEKAVLKTDAKNKYMPYVSLNATKTTAEETVSLWGDLNYKTVSDSGNYVAFLYRKPVGSSADYIEIYLNSNLSGANGKGDGNPAVQLIADGLWHFAVIDLTDNNDQSKNAYYDPQIGISSLRFDYFNKSRDIGEITDVAFVAMFDSIEDAFEYYDMYVDEYLGRNCGHDHLNDKWELVDDSDNDTCLAIEGLRCGACGSIADSRSASFKTCIDTLNGYEGALLKSVTWSSYEKICDEQIFLNLDGSIDVRGWAGFNGNVDGIAFRVLSQNGDEITDGWLNIDASILKVSPEDAISISVSSTLKDVICYPVRYSFKLDLGDYVKYGVTGDEGVCVEFAFVAADIPENSNDKYIPYLKLTDVLKVFPADDAGNIMFDYQYINGAVNDSAIAQIEYDEQNNSLPYVRLTYPENGNGEKTVMLWSNTDAVLKDSGAYIAVLYRIPEGCREDRIEFYINSTSEKPSAGANVGFGTAEYIGDGWLYEILYVGDVDNGTDYYDPDIGVSSLRFDYFNATLADNYLDVAFVAMFSDEAAAQSYFEDFAAIYLPGAICDHTEYIFKAGDARFVYDKVCKACEKVIETVSGITDEGLKVFTPDELKGKSGNGYLSEVRNDENISDLQYVHFELTYDMFTSETILWLNRNVNGIISNADVYVALMYRTNSENTANEMYISVDNLVSDGDNVVIPTVVADEEWHLGIFDFSDNGEWSASTGVNAMRLDIFNAKLGSGTYVDIAYIGFFGSEEAAESFFAAQTEQN